MKWILVILALAVLVGLSCAQISVNYRVEFNEDNGQCGGTDRATITIMMVPVYNTVRTVMEQAVVQNSAYQFQLEYSPSYAGYLVTQLVGVANQNPCQWVLYISAPGVSENIVTTAIDNFHVADNYTIIFRYEMGGAMITTRYSIEYPDYMCSNSTAISAMSVTTRASSSALEVMEAAAARLGERYIFSIFYESSSSQYIIQQLDGNEKTSTCTWMAYFVANGGTETLLTGSVAAFNIPEDNAQLILRFREEMLPTTPSPIVGMASTTGAAQSQHGVSTVLMVVPVIMSIILYVAF